MLLSNGELPRDGSLLGAVLLAFTLLSGCAGIKRFAYEGFWRDGWQKPDEVIGALDIRPGDQIADLGAGGGYFTFRFAPAVGPSGRVYAVDVDDDLLAYIEKRARDERLGNIGVVHAKLDDPLLPPAGIDLLFTCNTYHHIENRTAYFRNARKYLKPGARLAIIDFKNHGLLQRWFGHSTSAETIRQEIEAAGYRFERSVELLRQHFLVFSAV